ncbi:MAG TPA: hypothetical protein VK116_09725 [Planctomycetota bacterium]|nr:hypothetical protein [Planctomycetota bacterium]
MGFLACSIAYAALGAAVGLLFYRSRSLRCDGRVQAIALAATIGGGAATIASRDPHLWDAMLGSSSATATWAQTPAAQSYFLLCAAMFHVPVVVYVLLAAWSRLLERVTNPTRRQRKRLRPESESHERHRIEELRRALATNPIDPSIRRELAESYLRLGLFDSAIGELRRTAECVDRGYEQADLLYKAARILVDTKNDVRGALPILRRIVRLYPRSYFAAYARRVMNHYDAHFGLAPGTRGSSTLGLPPRDGEDSGDSPRRP